MKGGSRGRNFFIDVTGEKFGMLTAIRRTERSVLAPNGRRVRQWILRCECGTEVKRFRGGLKKSKTCGGAKCKAIWLKQVYKEKSIAKGPKVSSWKRMTDELKALRIENAQLKLKLGIV